jgi:hypothetical protein
MTFTAARANGSVQFVGVVRAHENDRDGPGPLAHAEPASDLESVQLRQSQLEHDDVGQENVRERNRLVTARRELDAKPSPDGEALVGKARVGVAVNKQNRDVAGGENARRSHGILLSRGARNELEQRRGSLFGTRSRRACDSRQNLTRSTCRGMSSTVAYPVSPSAAILSDRTVAARGGFLAEPQRRRDDWARACDTTVACTSGLQSTDGCSHCARAPQAPR